MRLTPTCDLSVESAAGSLALSSPIFTIRGELAGSQTVDITTNHIAVQENAGAHPIQK